MEPIPVCIAQTVTYKSFAAFTTGAIAAHLFFSLLESAASKESVLGFVGVSSSFEWNAFDSHEKRWERALLLGSSTLSHLFLSYLPASGATDSSVFGFRVRGACWVTVQNEKSFMPFLALSVRVEITVTGVAFSAPALES
jgi:hypothetical protein